MSPLRAMISAYIASQGEDYLVVEFRKKDGTLRRLPFRPSDAAEHINPDTSEAGREIAARTMAMHPHLMRVWSFEDEGFRSVNINTVYKLITRDGVLLFTRDADIRNVFTIIEK